MMKWEILLILTQRLMKGQSCSLDEALISSNYPRIYSLRYYATTAIGLHRSVPEGGAICCGRYFPEGVSGVFFLSPCTRELWSESHLWSTDRDVSARVDDTTRSCASDVTFGFQLFSFVLLLLPLAILDDLGWPWSVQTRKMVRITRYASVSFDIRERTKSMCMFPLSLSFHKTITASY